MNAKPASAASAAAHDETHPSDAPPSFYREAWRAADRRRGLRIRRLETQQAAASAAEEGTGSTRSGGGSGVPGTTGSVDDAAPLGGTRSGADGDDGPGRPWALCLSGGGIRSATFCLGALQGLARTPSPEAAIDPGRGRRSHPDAADTLLAQFDFLSTVSGGGYVGSFFSSLFVPGRLSGAKGESDAEAARRAYRALQDDPPQRMRAATRYDPQRPGAAALAWLRDNGRYLTPTGGGDTAYAAAIAVRNWFSVHFVVATVILAALSATLALRLAAARWPGFVALERFADPVFGVLVWSSTWWAATAAVVALALPFGIAYWFAHPARGRDLDAAARPVTEAWTGALALGVVGVALGWWFDGRARTATASGLAAPWPWAFLAVGALALAGCVLYTLTDLLRRPKNVSAQRVLLSRGVMRGLQLAGVLAALAVVETLAASVVHLVVAPGAAAAAGISAGAVTGAVVWAIRSVACRLQTDRSPKRRRAALPLSALAGVLAVLLWTVVATLLGALLLWLYADPDVNLRALIGHGDAATLRLALWGTVALVLLAALASVFPGFVNLSTFQPFYGARLTRAYLGASNHERFSGGSDRLQSVAEPAPGDILKTDELYRSRLAPLHFVNVCLNQTAGPEGQLVQRDRKGKPLATTAGGFWLDGEPHVVDRSGGFADLGAELNVGEWVGVSGAAVSTGLGRATSLGTSLLLGFANVRLGRWWPHGTVPAAARRFVASQWLLFLEMTGRFEGTRKRYAYLSDGGHFDNTAAYEMLRPERRVELLVVCDCGADPDYRFDDLANLVRLARIDHQLELRVNTDVLANPLLADRFAAPEDFRRGAAGELPQPSRRCAVLLDAFGCERAADGSEREALVARVVVVKPVAIAGAPLDVANYRAANAAFPQQPTGDQFFDEAQWESYRKLALHAVTQLFPQGDDTAYAQAFWAAVLAR